MSDMLPKSTDGPIDDSLLFAGGCNLGLQLEFSINLDMITERKADPMKPPDHEQTTRGDTCAAQAAESPFDPESTRHPPHQPHLSRRRTLRKLIGGHTRKASPDFNSHPQANHIDSPTDGRDYQLVDHGQNADADPGNISKSPSADHRSEFQLQLCTLPSSLALFSPELGWSAGLVGAKNSAYNNTISKIGSSTSTSASPNTSERTNGENSSDSELPEIEQVYPVLDAAIGSLSLSSKALPAAIATPSPPQQPHPPLSSPPLSPLLRAAAMESASAISARKADQTTFRPSNSLTKPAEQRPVSQPLVQLPTETADDLADSAVSNSDLQSDVPLPVIWDTPQLLQPVPSRPSTGIPVNRRWSVDQHTQYADSETDERHSVRSEMSSVTTDTPRDASSNRSIPSGKPPRRGRSLMFKPVLDAAAISAVLDSTSKRDVGSTRDTTPTGPVADSRPSHPSEVASSQAEDVGNDTGANSRPSSRRRLLGSLRRAATVTANKAAGRSRQQTGHAVHGQASGAEQGAKQRGDKDRMQKGSLKNTAHPVTHTPILQARVTSASKDIDEKSSRRTAKKPDESADNEEQIQLVKHEIHPIETTQTEDNDNVVEDVATPDTTAATAIHPTDAAAAAPAAPSAINTTECVDAPALGAEQQADSPRQIRRRAGTLNLGSNRHEPMRIDRLKQTPSLECISKTAANNAAGNIASPDVSAVANICGQQRQMRRSMRRSATNLTNDKSPVPGYVPIAVSLKGSRSRQFLLNTPLGEFEIQRTLGQGSYGKVKLMRSALTNEQFAVKIIKRYPAHKHRRSHHEYRKAKTLDRRVVREANLAAILGQLHPHIVPLHDFRVTDTHFYLFYAYVNGVTLAERVGSSGLNEDEARAVFKPVVETISFCHQYSVIHRDIKLENVLIDYADETENAWPLLLSRNNSTQALTNPRSFAPGSTQLLAQQAGAATGANTAATAAAATAAAAQGAHAANCNGDPRKNAASTEGNANYGRNAAANCRQQTSGAGASSGLTATDHRTASVFAGRIKIIDFGLANFFDGTSLMETFCGSLPYTAPEILRGDAYVGPEIDVWSLGVLLYVMLTGQFPFDDPAQAKNFDKIMAGDFALRPSMSRELQDLLLRMLEPNPKRRISMRSVMHHPWLMSATAPDSPFAAPAPGICCQHHPYPIVDAIHDRKTIQLPGPGISKLVAREVATCLDRSLDSVLQTLEAAVSSGIPSSTGQSASASGYTLNGPNGLNLANSSMASLQQWPVALQDFYMESTLMQVPNSPVVSVYALVLQQISMRQYYLELPAADECTVKGLSSSSSNNAIKTMANNALTLSSSSQVASTTARTHNSSIGAGAETATGAKAGAATRTRNRMSRGGNCSDVGGASGGLRAMAEDDVHISTDQPTPTQIADRPRTLVNKLTSQIGQLVSLTGSLISMRGNDSRNGVLAIEGSNMWKLNEDQQRPLSSANKKTLAQAPMARDIAQSVIAPLHPPMPAYVQPLKDGAQRPVTASSKENKSIFHGTSIRSRVISVRGRNRRTLSQLGNDGSCAEGLKVRCISILENADSRIFLPNELVGETPEHVLGLLTALLKSHEISHTFVETRRMPVHRAFDSSVFSLKTMAAMMASVYPQQQQQQQQQQSQRDLSRVSDIHGHWKGHDAESAISGFTANTPSNKTSVTHNGTKSVYADAQLDTGNNNAPKLSSDASYLHAADTGDSKGRAGQFKTLFQNMFAKTQAQPANGLSGTGDCHVHIESNVSALGPRRRLSQLPSQLRDRAALESIVSSNGFKDTVPEDLQTSVARSSNDQMAAAEVITTIPVKYATAVILAQYSPSLNRWRETEVVEYYSCSVRIELVRIAASSNLRYQHHRNRYALLVERMAGHNGKFGLFKIFLQRMVATLPSLAPESFDPRPAADPLVTVL
ncbi:Serine/threonine-protein kinase [Coemansia sp. Benny D115]|nr:Serine/threonine-protein kinase [Coemansia sp. Benny D115]